MNAVGDAGVPLLGIAVEDDDLGVGIVLRKLRAEEGAGDVAYTLAVAEELVPVVLVECALVLIFRFEGSDPLGTVSLGIVSDGVHVIALVDT